MFNPSRDQVRRFFCDAWQKDRQGLPLVGAETIAVDLIRLHPEYHALLADVERALSQEWTPEEGQMNPFLHLSLHLAVEEQISIDHPRGIREAFHALARRLDDPHAAKHRLLECLGEAVWHAQQAGNQLDPEAYLEAVKRVGQG